MTHINAYYGAVDEARLKVVQANGELQAAEEALKAHPDYVAPVKEKKTSDDDSVKIPVKRTHHKKR